MPNPDGTLTEDELRGLQDNPIGTIDPSNPLGFDFSIPPNSANFVPNATGGGQFGDFSGGFPAISGPITGPPPPPPPPGSPFTEGFTEAVDLDMDEFRRRIEEATAARSQQGTEFISSLREGFTPTLNSIEEAESYFQRVADEGIFTDQELNDIINRVSTANRLRTNQVAGTRARALRRNAARRLGSQSGAIDRQVSSDIVAPALVESLAQQSEIRGKLELTDIQSKTAGAQGLLMTGREKANVEQFIQGLASKERLFYDQLDQQREEFVAQINFNKELTKTELDQAFTIWTQKLDFSREQFQSQLQLEREQISSQGGGFFDVLGGIVGLAGSVAGIPGIGGFVEGIIGGDDSGGRV